MPNEFNASILFVDDEPEILTALTRLLRSKDLTVHTAISGEKGLQILEQQNIDIVVSDKNMPGMNGNEFLQKVAEQWPETVRIMLTAYTELNDVIAAINSGRVWSYMTKPWNNDELKLNIQQALNYSEFLAERSLLRHTLEQVQTKRKRNFMKFIGQSTAMQFVYDAIENCASSNASVFITGPSGAGKELAVDALHKLSSRKNHPLICLNCAAIPSELMESEIFGHIKGAFSGAVANRDGAATLADGGTLFLDELGEMDIGLQAKILRFIQTGTFKKVGNNKEEKVNIRFISATNREPFKAIEEGRLREDLYYRLNVISINIPPLKDRENDACQIAQYFLNRFSDIEQKVFVGLSSDAGTLIKNYSWPGNVRQLENTIHSAVVMSEDPLLTEQILASQLQLNQTQMAELLRKKSATAELESIYQASSNPINHLQDNKIHETSAVRSLAEVERAAIEHAIALCHDNIVKAASLLEVSPSTLYRKIQQWQD
ncbi:sigma-54-dependent transcriptional regulator [Paraglaciecola psychrophila]|uniref:Sigma 54-dependent DNA-binding response regulator n=1 Tax=Paraglaciecola psychrophila 170 TaxID=1129794 RepID=K6YXJ4_9ALTE|nr:sigma-54 dependent transcriptional regulator [Paraglaciecola psychrophila]AGH45656.1 sigma 54-dependent DNA-binding response regulator [Paraglaciecola psychrophila 170]GAC37434.1 two-component system, repressor protein LuxO [Paraglaciecola psychrophila 170]